LRARGCLLARSGGAGSNSGGGGDDSEVALKLPNTGVVISDKMLTATNQLNEFIMSFIEKVNNVVTHSKQHIILFSAAVTLIYRQQ